MLNIIVIYHGMVLFLSTSYRLLGIVYLDQLQGARHTHTSWIIACTKNIPCFKFVFQQNLIFLHTLFGFAMFKVCYEIFSSELDCTLIDVWVLCWLLWVVELLKSKNSPIGERPPVFFKRIEDSTKYIVGFSNFSLLRVEPYGKDLLNLLKICFKCVMICFTISIIIVILL